MTFFTAPNAPPLAAGVVTFWAVKGQDRRLSLYYHKAPGRSDSTEFVRFRVRPSSLLALPGGSPIADGDSVQITMTVVDSGNMILDFQPAGLRFDQEHPAELELRMNECDLDLNHDGVRDGADQAILRTSLVFRQETATDPWVPLPTVSSGSRFKTQVTGFTRYVLAY